MQGSSAPLSREAAALVSELGRRYLWWQPVGGEAHPIERSVAQIMNMGTYDDIRRLETVFDADVMANVMLVAQPGWFSARSWEFWRGRLSLSSSAIIPEAPPRRTITNAAVL